jgi:hypothetical protein
MVVGRVPGCPFPSSLWIEVAMLLRKGIASASIEPMALGKADPPRVSVTCETTVLCWVSEVTIRVKHAVWLTS